MQALGDMLRGGGGGSAEGDSSGLLSDWKAYEASGGAQADVEAGGGGSAPSQGGADGASTSAGALPFLSSTLSSAAGNVGATLGKMGSSAAAAVQDPSSAVQSAREALPDGSRLTYATALFGAGALLLFLAFVVALPVLIVFPAKFALSFTLGCACIVAGVAVLKGWREQMKHMISEDRRTFTAGCERARRCNTHHCHARETTNRLLMHGRTLRVGSGKARRACPLSLGKAHPSSQAIATRVCEWVAPRKAQPRVALLTAPTALLCCCLPSLCPRAGTWARCSQRCGRRSSHTRTCCVYSSAARSWWRCCTTLHPTCQVGLQE